MKYNLISTLLFILFNATYVFSQEVGMADELRENGKIFVVVIVLGLIMAGLFGYLFYLDRRLSKMENKPKK
ncbi:MAG: hypothetical protein RIC15_07010 [Vicingaceae bacterium]